MMTRYKSRRLTHRRLSGDFRRPEEKRTRLAQLGHHTVAGISWKAWIEGFYKRAVVVMPRGLVIRRLLILNNGYKSKMYGMLTPTVTLAGPFNANVRLG